MNTVIDRATIQKFDVPGPRYTSYPTAPVWSEEVTPSVYSERLKQFGDSDKTLSLYIHIPFCRSMCRFCACSVILRQKNDAHTDNYLEYLFKELEMVRQHVGPNKKIRQFHWGGGTPTFLTEEQIERLYHKVDQLFDLDRESEIAIEIDPRTIVESKVALLRKLGFNRLSMGVQDFDPQVQEAVNRIQPYEMVKTFNDYSRELGFDSINFDLIYGLPHQTVESFTDTIDRVIALRPDRIALYSFAYVPWLKKHQNKIDQASLPDANAKIDIFLKARERLMNSDYQAIAMDHFALKSDELSKSFNQGQLYRNFMGYTVKPADEYVGVGLSSIGFLENTFVQNAKTLKEYYAHLDAEELPVDRGKTLTRDDQIRQYVITQIMCHFKLDKQVASNLYDIDFEEYFHMEKSHLDKCSQEGLIEISNHDIKVTELGRLFVRNICMGFDYYLREQKSQARFSRTV